MRNKFFLFLPALLLACHFLTAQPQTNFYRAWTTNSSHLTQDFTNHVVSVVSGTDTYVAGSTLGSSVSTYVLALSKYNARGILQWSSTFTVNTGGNVHAGAIALDPSGNVLITGSAYNGTTNGYDLFVAKFNASGTKLWHQLYNGGGNSYDGGTAVVCGSNSNVYVSGGTSQAATNIDVVTICYNSSGTAQWTQTWNNVSYYDFAGGIGLVTSGGITSVRVTGFTQVNATTWEYLTMSYAANTGTLNSATHTSLGGTIIDQVNNATFDAAGNVYITGAMGNGSSGLDVKTVKLDAGLNIVWTATYNGSASLQDVGRGIALDASGNVYVAGYTSNTDREGLLIKYSASGTQIWAQTYVGAEGDDEFADLAVTVDTNIFVGGYTTRQGNQDFYAALYSLSGTKKWSDSQNGLANRDDRIQQVVADGLGNFIVSGTSVESDTSQNIMSTKYALHYLVIPNDEIVHSPFIAYHGQKLDTDGDPVTDLRYYSEKTYPNVYLFDAKVSYVFSHIDTVASTTDTMARVDMSFYVLGGRTSTVDGLDKQEGFHNYYLGHIPEGRERVPLQNKVLAPAIYPHIDAIYGQGDNGLFIHLICKAGSTPSSIKMEWSGATSVTVQSDSSLLVQTILEDLVLPRMTATTISSNGTETATSWRPTYSIGMDGKVSISLGTYDTDKTLVIKIGRGREEENNPCTYWSTYYGDSSNDAALGNDVDNSGNMYFTGNTQSGNFPTSIGAYQTQLEAPIDAYATRFKQPDVLVWSTYYGGAPANAVVATEAGYAIKWNPANGNVYFSGLTSSSDFPVLISPFSSAYNNDVIPGGIFTRGFIVKLKSVDGARDWATLFGDANCLKDAVTSMEILESGNIAVGGYAYRPKTSTPAFPATAASPQHSQSTGDGYIAEFSQNDALIWATRLAGAFSASHNAINDIAELSGNLIVTGTADYDNINNSIDNIPFGSPTYSFHTQGLTEVFIMRFSAGRTLLWSTFFGGEDQDDANSIVALANGDFVVTGSTMSSTSENFPAMMFGTNTSDAVNDLTLGGDADAFIAKFSSSNVLKWCRYLGGSGIDAQGVDNQLAASFLLNSTGNGTAVDGNILYLTGRVQNGFTPLKGQGCEHFYGTINGLYDAFLTIINDQNTVTFSTYWGGASAQNDDGGLTISTGTNGNMPFVLFGGKTNSGGGSNQTIPVCFESADAYYNNNLLNAPPIYDGFISKLYLDCQLVGTNEKQEKDRDLHFIPNPASNMITFGAAHESLMPESIRIFDASGKECTAMISMSIDNEENSSVDIHRLPAGLYFVQIQYENKLATGKFIKM